MSSVINHWVSYSQGKNGVVSNHVSAREQGCSGYSGAKRRGIQPHVSDREQGCSGYCGARPYSLLLSLTSPAKRYVAPAGVSQKILQRAACHQMGSPASHKHVAKFTQTTTRSLFLRVLLLLHDRVETSVNRGMSNSRCMCGLSLTANLISRSKSERGQMIGQTKWRTR